MRRVMLWLVATAIGTTVLVGAKAAPGTLPFGRSAHAPVDPAANDVPPPARFWAGPIPRGTSATSR
jgi:hypothetical protein